MKKQNENGDAGHEDHLTQLKEKMRVEFRQSLDILYADLKKPYAECRIKDRKHGSIEIPVTLEFERLQTTLGEGRIIEDLRKEGITSYSPRYSPCLIELLKILEAHPVAKESWPNGIIAPDFHDALKILDQSHKSPGKFILMEDRTHKKSDAQNPGYLTLIKGISNIQPEITAVRYSQHPNIEQDAGFNCKLEVTIFPSKIIDIGEDYIISYWGGSYYPRGITKQRSPIVLIGERIDEKGEYHSLSSPKYKFYSDEKEIHKMIKQVAKGPMYKAIRQVMEKN